MRTTVLFGLVALVCHACGYGAAVREEAWGDGEGGMRMKYCTMDNRERVFVRVGKVGVGAVVGQRE